MASKLKNLDFDTASNSSTSSVNSNRERLGDSRTPTTPNMRGNMTSEPMRSKDIEKPSSASSTSSRKPRVRLLDPVVGN